MLWLPLGQLIGWVVWLPLAWSVWIVEKTARLPYASFELGPFTFWLLILLWDRTLELMVNTHPDADHLGGLVSLLDRYEIEQALVSDVEETSQLYQKWEAELTEAQLTPAVGWAGTQLALGNGVNATILSPDPAIAGIAEPNNYSIVLHLQFGQVSFLLPGDIEEPVEQRLVQADVPLTATVLKSPHHGNKTSSSSDFLEAVSPQIVVVSVGEENRFGHLAPQVLERYAAYGLPVLQTDQHGTIEFSTDGKRLWIEMAE